MMIKLAINLILVCLLVDSDAYGFSVSYQDSLVEWLSKRPLKESDFKSGNFDNDYEALTSVRIRYRYETSNGKLNSVEIKAFFLPYKSWFKPKLNSTLLNHEQIHFDIAELFARKMRAYVSAIDSKKNDVTCIVHALDSIIVKSHEFDDEYDRSTSHGTNAKIQREWNEKIAKELAELKEYELLPKVVSIKSTNKKK
jgi:hypothetical protein